MGSEERSIFERCERSVFLHVNLDSLAHNVQQLRDICPNKKLGVIGVVKAGAYGHGSVMIANHLKKIGVERLAVATIAEGMQLRDHSIKGPIHIFGNVTDYQMDSCVINGFIPTVSSVESVRGMYRAMKKATPETNKKYQINLPTGCIHIKIDTGMCRNGCLVEELATIWKTCKSLEVPVEGMFTHFADSWGDHNFALTQLEIFMRVTEPYKEFGVKFHAANSGAILTSVATDKYFDFIRPGISLYGLPPHDNNAKFQAFNLRPIGSIIMEPTRVRKLAPGIRVGYSSTYEVTNPDGEWIATFPIGYADGVWRHLSSEPDSTTINGYVMRNATNELCHIVGRVSMDAITVRIPTEHNPGEQYSLITATHCPHTSAPALARRLGTISYEVMTRQSCRLPRCYLFTGRDGKPAQKIVKACSQGAY